MLKKYEYVNDSDKLIGTNDNVSDESLNVYFYSNCFIEALKAKIKNWKGIKITYIPPKYNEVYCPHFLWTV